MSDKGEYPFFAETDSYFNQIPVNPAKEIIGTRNRETAKVKDRAFARDKGVIILLIQMLVHIEASLSRLSPLSSLRQATLLTHLI